MSSRDALREALERIKAAIVNEAAESMYEDDAPVAEWIGRRIMVASP